MGIGRQPVQGSANHQPYHRQMQEEVFSRRGQNPLSNYISHGSQERQIFGLLCQFAWRLHGSSGVQARAAYLRLHPVLSTRNLTIQRKLHVYQSVVTSTLLYGLDAHVITTPALKKLESLQNKHLRAILKRPAFIYRDTNTEIREMISATAVHSQLLINRLLLLKRMAKNPQESVAAFAALWGNPANQAGRHHPAPWAQQLRKDVLHASSILDADPLHIDTPDALAKWCLHTSKAKIKTLSSTTSPVDPKRRVQTAHAAPVHRCAMCSYCTHSNKSLVLHCVTKHNYRNLASQLITSSQCPVCEKHFASLSNTRQHYLKKCTHQVPEYIIQRLLCIASPPILVPAGTFTQPTLHQFFSRKHSLSNVGQG